MSRRTSAIHLIVVTTNTKPPSATMYQLSVIETIAIASAAALITGIRLGSAMIAGVIGLLMFALTFVAALVYPT